MKEKICFSLFQSHLDLAHRYWKQHLNKGDWAIDATCGNGQDTLLLAQILSKGGVIGIDLQKEAIDNTKRRLGSLSKNVHLFHQSHEQFPPLAHERPIRLIAYNLGYLPGGNKEITTQTPSTLTSVNKAKEVLQPGGILSITCYSGHEQGQKEQEALLAYLSNLCPKRWSLCYHRWLNRKSSPSLLIIQKNCSLY